MSGCQHVVWDDDMGAIASVLDDQGNIIATASSGISDGVYMAVDESAYFAATGNLLPAPLWDAAKCRCHNDETPPTP